ncbi:MAG: hypothetical protein OEQ53_14950 [Saprospiraceae bacterium]|nr:hypothetical protein [Saprospiraceae bacterium]
MRTSQDTFKIAADLMKDLGLNIVKQDKNRPWGGYYVIEESQAQIFASHFFPEEDFELLKLSEKLSPKILMVAPKKRLSWQYHHRRAEIWCCIDGSVGVATSHSDEETNNHILHIRDKIKLQQGERHRLIGLNDWGMVAEIWQHTDADHPSDEEDIIRLQDDFGR